GTGNRAGGARRFTHRGRARHSDKSGSRAAMTRRAEPRERPDFARQNPAAHAARLAISIKTVSSCLCLALVYPVFTMLHDWYRAVRLPIGLEEFQRLPRHPAFQYEYADGAALLSPRPRTLNALLTLRPHVIPPAETLTFRPVEPGDWAVFPGLFAAAFRHVQPFAGLTDADCHQASVECLEQTRNGGDGPL